MTIAKRRGVQGSNLLSESESVIGPSRFIFLDADCQNVEHLTMMTLLIPGLCKYQLHLMWVVSAAM